MKNFEYTDRVDEAVTRAASIIADEFYRQNGEEEHDDSWYELQEDLRKAMLTASFGVVSLAETYF